MEAKAIITNCTLLNDKYGSAGFSSIQAALDGLVAADAQRGLTSVIYDISDPATMGPLAGTAVTTDSPKAVKEAIDGVCAADKPAYVVLLGGPEVIPHQSLVNPLARPYGNDPDPDVPSDLPYACDAPYSREIADFMGPTRVVGRLPDLAGAADPSYLVDLINKAASWRNRPQNEYMDYFGVSTETWRNSSSESARKVFGSSSQMELSPPGDDTWSAATLQRRSHFINCHGDIEDPRFYGEGAGRSSMPVSLSSPSYTGAIAEGAVVAAECCYGAELYDPHGGDLGATMAICNRLLAEGGYAFMGSTNVAYGPPSGNGAADYICQFFFNGVLAGASTGRAMLEARQEFVARAAPLSLVDFKTLGQFILLGDPSIHPVAPEPQPEGAMAAKAFAAGDTAGIPQRRSKLVKRGLVLARTIAQPGPVEKLSDAMAARLLKQADVEVVTVMRAVSIPLREGQGANRKDAPLRSKPAVCHVVTAQRPAPEAKPSKAFDGAVQPKRSMERKALLDYLARAAVIVEKVVEGETHSVQTLLPH